MTQNTHPFHRPAEESWICGLLKNRHITIVLDLGCGLGLWGFILRTYAASNAKIVDADISARRLEMLRNLDIYDELILGDATTLDFNNDFDAILVVKFLHQVGDKERFLRTLEGKLTKNRLLIISGHSTPEVRKILQKRNYSLYEYFFRRPVLIDTNKGEIILMHSSKATRILASLLLLGRRFVKSRNNVHIIAFKGIN